MTNKNLCNKLKTKLAIILAFMFILCMTVFCFTACGEKEESERPSFSFTNEEDGEIANAYFKNDTATKKLDAYPIVSATSWNKSYHNNAYSSNVDSGVIDVSSKPWEELSADYLSDGDLINALCDAFQDDIIEKIRTEKNDPSYNATNAECKEYIKQHFDDIYYKNPGTHTGAKESKMYVINNYTQSAIYRGIGTAQTVTNSANVTIEAGKYAHLSIWVKTANLTGSGDPDKFGANIRLTNSVNGTTQSEYRISSIKADEWTQYHIYIKADATYTCNFTLSFGLGYGSGSSTAAEFYTQGTAFFDDIEYEVLDNVDNVDFNGKVQKMVYAGDKAYETIAKDQNTNYLYDMTFSYPNNFFTDLTSNNFSGFENGDYFTTSNVTTSQTNKLTSKDIYANGSINATKPNTNTFKLELNKASASIKLSSSDFILDSEETALVSFKLTNKLKPQGNTTITIDAYDVLGSEVVKRAAIATIDTVGDDAVTYTLSIANNFASVNDREFYIVFVVGPTDINTVKYANDLASGTVTISDLKIYKGVHDHDVENDPNHDYYHLASSDALASLPLYAGYSQDYTEVENEVNSHNLTTKPSDFGTIINYPANLKNYEGIPYNHIYVSEDLNDKAEKKVDTRSGNKGKNTSYAGLINTNWLDNYQTNTGLDIESNIGTITEDIQPLMIYNHTKDAYGYLSEKFTINESSYSKFSVKVRVTGDAAAYIYLVDVSKVQKDVLTFDTFTPNVSSAEIGGLTVGEYNPEKALELAIRIDADTLKNADEEWVTVNFFVATGATAKDVRLEIWNGSRDGVRLSQGYVFFDEIVTATNSGFIESSSWSSALYEDSSNPLYSFDVNASTSKELFAYKRPLTDIEKQFNAEYPDKAISPKANYVWAKTDTMIYAVYNTIDPQVENPYDNIEEEEESAGCAATADPATFWLNFSSILLGVCLIAAIIMLIIKNLLRKRKANESDARSHYKVRSRISAKKKDSEVEEENKTEEILDEEIIEVEEESTEEEIVEESIDAQEQNLDEYVYGEIEEFSSESEEKTSDDEESKND